MLNNIENYGVYLAEALASPTVDTSEYVNGITLVEPNIGKFSVAMHIYRRLIDR